ncbi:acetolactate synthase [Puniceicoccales bacterium CK1056]|uniref:Acetolactate synthase n=1 Tax=Oceanipulchritudo coccoides TaxID=2706888 RepID=A0A6B2M6D6_9BACT|nr:acetolactate synthase [Oceanipulchritudo coccoides]NDV63230.1 acetolactate synthase [Oceanipulchritudo coccoides]
MEADVAQSREKEPVLQFSVFSDNKVGRLNDLIQRFGHKGIHIMALSQLDSTECTIMRFIPDYPEEARQMLKECSYAFSECPVLAVEMNSEADLKFITSALLEAEINIHYLYPFITRPNGRCGLAMNVEDYEFAESVLHARQVRCLSRGDIAR